MSLTELTIKSLKPKSKLYRIADGGGLTLEVSPTGSKLWRLRYRHHGKGQVIALGKYPAISLAEARRKRDEMKTQVSEGKHLSREKKASKPRRITESENTFESVAHHWMTTKQKGLNQKYVTQNLARMEQRVFPMISSLPIAEITIPNVVHVIESISERGTIETAKRMKQSLAKYSVMQPSTAYAFTTPPPICTTSYPPSKKSTMLAFTPANCLNYCKPSRSEKMI